MASCPNCHSSIEILDKHLGTLFTCANCNAVFFVNWEGEPEMASHEADPVETPEEFVSHLDQNYQGVDPNAYGEETRIQPPPQAVPAAPELGYEPSSAELQNNFEPPVYNMTTPEDPSSGSEIENIHTIPNAHFTPTQEQDPSMYEHPPATTEEREYVSAEPTSDSEVQEEPYDFSRSLDQQPEEVVSHGMDDSANFADVTDFANANLEAGPLTYVVIIDGVESSHLLKQLREAMTDSRFAWDVNDVLTHLGGGRLVLNGLSPAKASVLINRIKYLPFKISWRQDVLSSS